MEAYLIDSQKHELVNSTALDKKTLEDLIKTSKPQPFLKVSMQRLPGTGCAVPPQQLPTDPHCSHTVNTEGPWTAWISCTCRKVNLQHSCFFLKVLATTPQWSCSGFGDTQHTGCILRNYSDQVAACQGIWDKHEKKFKIHLGKVFRKKENVSKIT